jgi:hypothetical protein
MKDRSSGKRWLIIVGSLVALFVIAFLIAPSFEMYVIGSTKGWYYRTFKMPAITKAAFVEDLHSDEAQARAQADKFLSTYRSSQGDYGLRRTMVSADGEPIGMCIVTESGKLTFVMDHTRNRFSNREFSVAHPEGVGLASSGNGTNTHASAPAPSGSAAIKFYLISYISGRGVAF